MAKSNHRAVDKLERRQRVDARRQRSVESNEFRNMSRIGWRETLDINDEDLERGDESQWADADAA